MLLTRSVNACTVLLFFFYVLIVLAWFIMVYALASITVLKIDCIDEASMGGSSFFVLPQFLG